MIHREFKSRLNSLGTAIRKMCFCWSVDRTDLVELFAQLGHMPIIKIGAAKMYQLRNLFLNCGNDLRMTVSGRTYRDSGITV